MVAIGRVTIMYVLMLGFDVDSSALRDYGQYC